MAHIGNCHSLIGLSTVQGSLNFVQEGDRSLLVEDTIRLCTLFLP
jgi:hypothetical protein